MFMFVSKKEREGKKVQICIILKPNLSTKKREEKAKGRKRERNSSRKNNNFVKIFNLRLKKVQPVLFHPLFLYNYTTKNFIIKPKFTKST